VLGLYQEYNIHLFTPLLHEHNEAKANNRPMNYEWLKECHLHNPKTALNRPYSFLEDLALCLRIIDRGEPGKTIPLAWFSQNVHNQIPELSLRTYTSVENRYRLQLKVRLGRACRSAQVHNRPLSWNWLYKLHRTSPKEVDIAAVTGGEFITQGKLLTSGRSYQDDNEGEDDDDFEEVAPSSKKIKN
jgi:hypothetical protein